MKKNMEKEERCTITQYEGYHIKEYRDEAGRAVRQEAYNDETGECYSTNEQFYDEQGQLIRESNEWKNGSLHFLEDIRHREEGDFHIVETVTRFVSSPIGQRDERRIEVHLGWRCAARTYDLETGALVGDELYHGDTTIYEHTYPLARKDPEK